MQREDGEMPMVLAIEAMWKLRSSEANILYSFDADLARTQDSGQGPTFLCFLFNIAFVVYKGIVNEKRAFRIFLFLISTVSMKKSIQNLIWMAEPKLPKAKPHDVVTQSKAWGVDTKNEAQVNASQVNASQVDAYQG